MTTSTSIHSYHLLSGVYDSLATLWSWGQIAKSRNQAIGKLMRHSNILILGPGTCQGFEAFGKGNSNLTLVDSSAEMLQARGGEWKAGLNSLPTVHICDVREYQPHQRFDCIWLPYFLNVFSTGEVIAMLSEFKSWLKDSGEIHISDFMAPDTRWFLRLFQEAWHGLPMAFFHAVTGNAWHSIHDLPRLISDAGFQMTDTLPTGFGPSSHPWIGNYVCKPL